jgi:sugar phosphate isomerase/epimerase
VEVNTCGFIPSPHCHVDLLLSSAQARRDYLELFASRGMELTGLNCNGNPLNPLPGVGPKHADDLRRTIELAGLLGVPNVVTMSGTPGSDPGAKYPSWVVNPWDGCTWMSWTTSGTSPRSSGPGSACIRWPGRWCFTLRPRTR